MNEKKARRAELRELRRAMRANQRELRLVDKRIATLQKQGDDVRAVRALNTLVPIVARSGNEELKEDFSALFRFLSRTLAPIAKLQGSQPAARDAARKTLEHHGDDTERRIIAAHKTHARYNYASKTKLYEAIARDVKIIRAGEQRHVSAQYVANVVRAHEREQRTNKSR